MPVRALTLVPRQVNVSQKGKFLRDRNLDLVLTYLNCT